MAQRSTGSAAAAAGDGGGGGGGGGGGRPAPFLTKTYQMVEERETEEVISWEEKGRSFVVWKPVEFARDILPVHFKHNNFSSFVRQLNTYGFRKVVPDRWEFANDNFRRGEQSLLAEIRRRKATSPQQGRPHAADKPHSGGRPPSLPPPPPSAATNSAPDVHSSSSAASSPPPPPPSPVALRDLTHENERLRNDNRLLSTELAHAKLHCERLLGFLSQFLDVSQLDLGSLMQEDAVAALKERLEARDEAKSEGCVKLFGVLLNSGCRMEGSRKRGWREEGDGCGAAERPMKMGFGEPWPRVQAAVQLRGSGGGKMCG